MSSYKLSDRITLRGKLDSLNAQIILLQTLSGNHAYISDLEEVRAIVRELQAHEAGGKTFSGGFSLWGMTDEELHALSHNPQRGHILPHPDMKTEAAGVNVLRTLVREVELCAWRAFPDDELGLCHVLNRLSSAIYILTYKYLPEGYNHVLTFGKKGKVYEQIQV